MAVSIRTSKICVASRDDDKEVESDDKDADDKWCLKHGTPALSKKKNVRKKYHLKTPAKNVPATAMTMTIPIHLTCSLQRKETLAVVGNQSSLTISVCI